MVSKYYLKVIRNSWWDEESKHQLYTNDNVHILYQLTYIYDNINETSSGSDIKTMFTPTLLTLYSHAHQTLVLF